MAVLSGCITFIYVFFIWLFVVFAFSSRALPSDMVLWATAVMTVLGFFDGGKTGGFCYQQTLGSIARMLWDCIEMN
jgi:hypothetical protein